MVGIDHSTQHICGNLCNIPVQLMQSLSANPLPFHSGVPVHQDYVRGNNFLKMCDHVLTMEVNRTMIDSLKIFLETVPHIRENDIIFCKNEFIISEGFERVLEEKQGVK